MKRTLCSYTLLSLLLMCGATLAAHAMPVPDTKASLNNKGLIIASDDKQYEMSLRGYAQFDVRNFLDDSANAPKDSYLARRIRPTLQVKANDLSLRFVPDVTTSPMRIMDAHMDYRFAPLVQLRIGKFKPPISLERLQSGSDTAFIERAFPSNFAPTRDVGIQLYGNTHTLEYQLGIFEGDEDLGTRHSDEDKHKDIYARIFGRPFSASHNPMIQDIALGFGSSYGTHQGTLEEPLTTRYRSFGQQTIFRYASDTVADGTQWRIYPQATLYHNNWGLLAEFALNSQALTRNTHNTTLRHHAWQLEGSYILTGEKASFSGGVKPQTDFNPLANGWGAWEVVGRISGITFDRDSFAALASANNAVRSGTNLATGVNWYVNPTLSLATNYSYSFYDGGATANRDRTDEQALFTRLQLRF